MQLGPFISSALCIFIVLQTNNISKIYCQELPYIAGCKLFNYGVEGISAKCTEFNTSYVPFLLPNNTKTLYISRVKSLPTTIPLVPRLTMLTKLQLPYNDIQNISNVTFEGLENLFWLDLKFNYIKHIPPDSFVNTLKLEIVDLSNNFLVSLTSVVLSFSNLENLKYLYLSHNKLLESITDVDFIPLKNSNLQSLDISFCDFRIIEANAFKSLKFLTSLDISNNPLSRESLENISFSLTKENLNELIAKDMFAMSYFSCRFLKWLQSTHIAILDLSLNRFVICFPAGNFMHLKSLKLNRCDNLQLRPSSFSKMTNLEILEITEHRIFNINEEFKFNIHLKILNLSHFIGIKLASSFKINEYAFENQQSLTILTMQNLPIKTSIERYMLYGLKSLQTLIFFKSSIPSIECYAFETLNNLNFLDLSVNTITELSNCSFYGLIKVKNIDLSDNALTFISDANPFDCTPELEFINLNSNKIAKLPVGLFAKLNNLVVIRLNDNILHPWSQRFLPETTNISALFLKKNAITHFTEEMLEEFFGVQEFDFSGNPINCSHCSTLKLQRLIVEKTLKISNGNKTILYTGDIGSYVCYDPDILLGQEIVTVNLSSVTAHCFPVERDISKILYAVFSSLLGIFIISSIAWYRWSWNIKYYIFLLKLNTMKYKDQLHSGRFTFDAYVFHCEEDVEWIRKHLIPALENKDPELRLCLPDRNFDVGIAVLDNTTSAINNSRSTIIILSNHCLNSNWCLFNIQLAQNMFFEKTRNGLIIVLLEKIQKEKLTKDLQYVLRTRTCIWWPENPVGQQLFWERLRLAISRPADRGISAHIT